MAKARIRERLEELAEDFLRDAHAARILRGRRRKIDEARAEGKEAAYTNAAERLQAFLANYETH